MKFFSSIFLPYHLILIIFWSVLPSTSVSNCRIVCFPFSLFLVFPFSSFLFSLSIFLGGIFPPEYCRCDNKAIKFWILWFIQWILPPSKGKSFFVTWKVFVFKIYTFEFFYFPFIPKQHILYTYLMCIYDKKQIRFWTL